MQDPKLQMVLYMFWIKSNTFVNFSMDLKRPVCSKMQLRSWNYERCNKKKQPKRGLQRLLSSLFIELMWHVKVNIMKIKQFCFLHFLIWVCNIETDFKLILPLNFQFHFDYIAVNYHMLQNIKHSLIIFIDTRNAKKHCKIIGKTPNFLHLQQVFALLVHKLFTKLFKIT